MNKNKFVSIFMYFVLFSTFFGCTTPATYNLDHQAQEFAKVLNVNIQNNLNTKKDTKKIVVSNIGKYVKITFPNSTDENQYMRIKPIVPVLKKYPKAIIQILGGKDISHSIGEMLNQTNLSNSIFIRLCTFSNLSDSNIDKKNKRIEIYIYPNYDIGKATSHNNSCIEPDPKQKEKNYQRGDTSQEEQSYQREDTSQKEQSYQREDTSYQDYLKKQQQEYEQYIYDRDIRGIPRL